MILQSHRVLSPDHKLTLDTRRPEDHGSGGSNTKNGSKTTAEKEEEVIVLNDLVTFRCSNAGCKAGFPLKENTKEKLIKCPMEACGKETNIWLKLKRFQVRFFLMEPPERG